MFINKKNIQIFCMRKYIKHKVEVRRPEKLPVTLINDHERETYKKGSGHSTGCCCLCK